MKSLLVKYDFSPGLYDEIRSIDLDIFDDLSYKLKIRWYKKYQKNDVFDEDYAKSKRAETIVEDNLPQDISDTLKELISFPVFKLNRFYPELTEENKKKYTPLDVRHENYHFHINKNEYWINVSPYIFKKEFLKSHQELIFLRFHESISLWIDEFYNTLIEKE
jgi:hypothetical protein